MNVSVSPKPLILSPPTPKRVRILCRVLYAMPAKSFNP